MEAAIGGDDGRCTLTVQLSPLSREFDRALVGLRAGAAEEDAVEGAAAGAAAGAGLSALLGEDLETYALAGAAIGGVICERSPCG